MTALCSSDQSGEDIVPCFIPGQESARGWGVGSGVSAERWAMCKVFTNCLKFYPQETHSKRVQYFLYWHDFHILNHLCLWHKLEHYFHCLPNISARLVKNLYNSFIRVSRVLIQHLLCDLIVLFSVLDKSKHYFWIVKLRSRSQSRSGPGQFQVRSRSGPGQVQVRSRSGLVQF